MSANELQACLTLSEADERSYKKSLAAIDALMLEAATRTLKSTCFGEEKLPAEGEAVDLGSEFKRLNLSANVESFVRMPSQWDVAFCATQTQRKTIEPVVKASAELSGEAPPKIGVKTASPKRAASRSLGIGVESIEQRIGRRLCFKFDDTDSDDTTDEELKAR
ncbi:MAG: hypothetical protein MHM6MM_003302 [Cercozoa sp. M6MM]